VEAVYRQEGWWVDRQVVGLLRLVCWWSTDDGCMAQTRARWYDGDTPVVEPNEINRLTSGKAILTSKLTP